MTHKTARLPLMLPAFTLVFATVAWATEQPRQRQPQRRPPATRHAVARKLKCGDVVKFQVLLDRQGFSPGQIDRATTVTMTRALTAFQTARQLAATGKPDCDTWRALDDDTSPPAIVEYEISTEDAEGPFTERIPAGLDKQADLPALEYRSVLELLSERFHAAPSLLISMNRGVRFTAGRMIKVPGVTPFDATKPARGAPAGEIAIQVSREDSALRATRADGTVVLFAPVGRGAGRRVGEAGYARGVPVRD